MEKKAGYLTVEQAVACLINCDYIPEGFTLLEMTAAVLEDAQGTYESAQGVGMDGKELELIACWANSCEARHELAHSLMESLQRGIELSESDLKFVTDKSSGTTRVSLKSLGEWAAFRFGIQLPPVVEETNESSVAWEEVTIKIYVDFKIGFKRGKEKYQRTTFQKIGLMGGRKSAPNNLGGLLLALCLRKKFPVGNRPNAAQKTAICKLRDSLKKLTGLSKDPFTRFNAADGWKPRFTLIDDRGNADERAKNRAEQVPYNEQMSYERPDYMDENDEAGEFLKGK